MKLGSIISSMEFIRVLLHPREFCALLIHKLKRKTSDGFSDDGKSTVSPELMKCYTFMDNINEAVSVGIRTLDGEFRDAVCLLFLILRALDGIEDEASISEEEKLRLLPEFYRFLENPSWTYNGVKNKNGCLLADFATISSQYRQLNPIFQVVISDVCAQMGAGMAKHLNKDPDSMEELEEYGFYISTIFFIGIMRMFSGLGTDARKLDVDKDEFKSIGDFQLKVDVIQDFYEDMLEGRQFWPREIWSKYAKDLKELSRPEKTKEALSCLNEMVANTLNDVPGVLQWHDRIQNLPIFEFFAVLQVLYMAILERCYNNQQLFHGSVNIRNGEKAYLMMRAKNITNVKAIFSYYLKKIEQRIPGNDPSGEVTRSAIKRSLSLCSVSEVQSVGKIYLAPFAIFAIFLAMIVILF